MKRHTGKVAAAVVFLIVFSAGMLAGSLNVAAQESGGSLAKQILGTWILVSIYNETDGKRTDLYGANPRGINIFTPDGHFTQFLMKESLPKFAANNRLKGTDEENRAVVQGCHAIYGTYKIASEKDRIVMLHITGNTYPNFDGQDQQRIVTINGDEMKVTNPTAGAGGTNYVVWKRFK